MNAPASRPSRIQHFVAREAITVLDCLERHFKVNASRGLELLRLGAIYHNKKRVFDNLRLEKGAYLRLHLEPKRFPVERVNWDGLPVCDEREFLVVNKPPAIPVHATLDNACDNVLHQLRARTKYPLLVTQRLDVPVGGLLVFAKTPDFQRRFNQWLGERRIEKRYAGLVEGVPPLGHHVHYMEPSERSPKRMSTEPREGWLRCELSIHACRPEGQGNEIEVELHTGRTHQIRAQLSSLNCPLLGDRVYGSHQDFPGGLIALFARALRWPKSAPASGHWEFSLPPPWRK